jgi:hypothetical protein
VLLHLGAGGAPGESLYGKSSFSKGLCSKQLRKAELEEMLEYDRLLDQLHPRMKHLSSRELAEPLKVANDIICSQPFSNWKGWDVKITTLTSETIQQIRELNNTHKKP